MLVSGRHLGDDRPAMLVSTAVFVSLFLPGPATAENWRPPELEVAAPPAATDFSTLRELAHQYLGRPYVSGGVGNPGFDCSGFVCRVYAEAGYALPRVSRDQAKTGRAVRVDQIRPGDLLFFAEPGAPVSHVGLYLGDDDIIHASSGQGEVATANLNASWFRNRLVGARRILTSTLTVTSTVPYEAPVARELEEHEGEYALPAMLRRPPRHPEPSYGPQLLERAVTSVSIRVGLISEQNLARDKTIFGMVFTPELKFHYDDWALDATVAVPVRFEVDGNLTPGPVNNFSDASRFLRNLSLGLPGADLELRLTRLGDLSLLRGFVLDHLTPGTAVQGVTGMTLARSPLSLFGRTRIGAATVEGLIDDVIEPGVMGLGLDVSLPGAPLSFGVAYATDQRAQAQAGRRALLSTEGQVVVHAVDSYRWNVDLGLHGAVQSALGEPSGGGALRASAEYRFAPRSSFGIEARGSLLGTRYLEGLLGPTYIAHRVQHLEALPELSTRLGVGGGMRLRVRKLLLGVDYGQAVGPRRHPLDRRLEAILELKALTVGRQRVDLRAVYLLRAPFDPDRRLHVAQGAMRMQLNRWLFVDLYAQKGETWQGGGGLTISWAP